jgi:hypothetical protein
MWRKFFKIFGATVVMTEDYDGVIRIRFAKKTPFGLRCGSIYDHLSVELNPDGSCSGKCYVKRWAKL